jgi:hypothetical protein
MSENLLKRLKGLIEIKRLKRFIQWNEIFLVYSLFSNFWYSIKDGL